MGASASFLPHDLDVTARDITSHQEALAEVQRIRALLLTTNNTRAAQLLCLSPEAMRTHNQSILHAMTRREADRKKDNIEAEKRGDYSKCHSGTAEDTKNEAEAAKLLKGTVDGDGEESNDGEYAILKPLDSQLSMDALRALETKGKWMRYLNMNDCYGYVHGLTLEVRGNRPDAYVDAEEEQNTQKELAKNSKAKNGGAQLHTIQCKELREKIDQVENMSGKTLLLLTDGEHNETLRTYFAMHGVVCDVAPLGLSTGQMRKQGVRVKNVLENCRQSVVKGLQNGLMCGIFIGDIDGEDMPILEKLCKKPLGGPSVFPKQLFANKGKGLFTKFAAGSSSKLHLHRLYRDEDKDVSGGCVFKLKFQTIIISNCSAHTYKRQLKNCFPLETFEIVVVE
jgi:hypothetical protein